MDTVLRRLVIVAVFACAANVFFFQVLGTGAVSVTAVAVALLLTLLYSHRMRQAAPAMTPYVVTVLLLAGLAVWRGSPVVQTLMYGGAFVTLALYAYSLAAGIPAVRSFTELLLVPFSVIGAHLSTYLDGISASEKLPALLGLKRSAAQRLATGMAGVVVGIPIVGVLLVLLMNADPIFAKVVRDSLSLFRLDQLWQRLALTAGVFLFLAPLGFLKINREFSSPSRLFTRWNIAQIVTVVLLMVSAVLGLFLIVQWPYIFVRVAGETDLSRYGVATYSEYVKRGFTELLLIAALVYGLLWGGLLALRSRGTGTGRLLPAVQFLTLAEFAVFVLSVGRRIKLYWDFHGLTLVRVYGGIFLIWISLFTATLFLRLWIRQRMVRWELALTAILLFAVGVWNAEQFIVTHHPPTVNGQVDHVYLARLSPDGYEGWLQAFTHARTILDNPALDSAPVIGKEERRNLAYAGMTIGILTQRYHDLLNRQGSPEDRRAYYTAVLTAEQQRIATLLPELESDLVLISQRGNGVNAKWDPLFIPTYSRDYRSSEISATINSLREADKRIAESLTTLADTNGDGTRQIAITVVQSPAKLTNFTQGPCGMTFYGDMATQWCIPSFYTVFPNGLMPFAEPSAMSRLSRWNLAEQLVYARMRGDMPFTELQRLQERYLTLLVKVLGQPDQEKEYQQDISLDAPFLAPIR